MEGKLIDLRFLFKADLLILPVLSCSALYRLLTCSCGKVCDCWALQLMRVSRTVTSSSYREPQFFFWFLVVSHVSWDLSSPTRDWNWLLAVKAPSPNHWTSREFPKAQVLFHWKSWMARVSVLGQKWSSDSSCVTLYLLWASKYRWGLSLEFLRPQYKPSFWDNDISSVSHRTCGGQDRQDTRYEITVTGETMTLECHQTDNHDYMYWYQ